MLFDGDSTIKKTHEDPTDGLDLVGCSRMQSTCRNVLFPVIPFTAWDQSQVLPGRQFPSFSAGDVGVVKRVDDEELYSALLKESSWALDIS